LNLKVIFLNEQVTKQRFWCTDSSKCPVWICQ